MKFSNARYINTKAVDISPQEYRTIYFKKIYCPNPKCPAMLSHYVITKNNHRFFRTFKGFKHIENCTYDKLYTGQYPVFKKDEAVKVNVSDEDILARLKRAYSKYINPIVITPKEESPELKKHIKSDSINNKGIPASFDEGIDLEDKKLPYVYSRKVNEVTDDDRDKVRCIIGKVYSMKIENTHAYINLTPKKEDSVNVLFNPHFKDRYSNLYDCLPDIKKYIATMKLAKTEIICCCIGWVRVVGNKNVKHKYNIELLKDVAITLNGICLREILYKK